jgi:ABC-type transporter Mla MlaB component
MRSRKGPKELLRVTIQDANGHGLTLKVEGKLAGAQVPELRRAWDDLRATMGPRRLVVDLCGLTHVDGTGRSLLAEIYAGTGAEFVADTPLSKYFAKQATKGSDEHDPSE